MSQLQPLDQLYPNNPVTNQPSSSSSDGSFGPVFIVLAVIVVLSAMACVLSRICNRRHTRVKEAPIHEEKANKKVSQGLGPKEWETRQKPSFNMRDGDIEFGFEKRTPSAKGARIGGMKGNPHQKHGGHVRFASNV